MKKTVKQLEDQGNEAFVTKNQKKWTTTNENLLKTLQRIEKAVLPPPPPPPIVPPPEIPTPVLKDRQFQIVANLRNKLESKRAAVRTLPDYSSKIKSRCDEFEKMIDKMEADIQKVDDKTHPSQAQGLLMLAMNPRQKLEARIPNLDDDTTA
jgi:hypothetical protein